MIKNILVLTQLIILFLFIIYNPKFNKIFKTGSGENSKTINWENKLIFPEISILELLDKVEKLIPDFGPIRKTEMTELINLSKIEKYPPGMLISIRNILSTKRAIESKKNISNYIQKIKFEYGKIKSGNLSISDYFKEIPLPPLTILKILNQNNIKVSPVFFNWCKNNDFEEAETFKKILKKSNEFEEILIDWLKKKYPKISFQTQQELYTKQKEKYKKAIATPDILFDEPVIFKISGPNWEQTQLIRWLDAKNYTLFNVDFLVKHIRHQSEKYNNLYGPGALVFRYGYTERIQFQNTIILDASFIESS